MKKLSIITAASIALLSLAACLPTPRSSDGYNNAGTNDDFYKTESNRKGRLCTASQAKRGNC